MKLISIRPISRVLLLLFMVASIVTTGGGCAGTQPLLIAGVPDDLSLDLVVLPAPGITNEVVGSLALPTQRMHFVLHPNGNLHVQRGGGTAANAYPKLARHLSTHEMLSIWQKINQIQFVTAATQRMRSMELVEDPTVGVSFAMWVRAQGQERIGRIDSMSASGSDVELTMMVQLVNELERLVWNR